MVGINLIFIELLILGAVFVILSIIEYYSVSIKTIKKTFKSKAIAVSFFVLGFIIHTLGDFLGENMELLFETAGHILIMIGAIMLIIQTINLMRAAEEFGYG